MLFLSVKNASAFSYCLVKRFIFALGFSGRFSKSALEQRTNLLYYDANYMNVYKIVQFVYNNHLNVCYYRKK